MFLITPIVNAVQTVGVLTWDLGLTIGNLVTPSRKVGHVTPPGHPGLDGKWPEYIAPKEGDSRCSCPALNALANHGILPHDGKNIKFDEFGAKIRSTYNFASSFCFFRNYRKDTFDLADLDLHNGIEHDASLTREDSALVPSQAKPHVPFIKELLDSASGKDKEGNVLLTQKDLSDYSAKRRVDAHATNPDFTLSTFHKVFGSSNSSTLITIFGGRVDDLESILIEERLPDGWESRIRKRLGLTMTVFNATVLKAKLAAECQKAPPTESTD
ncbi:Chloroperoxidase [Pholiota molesta]|nr:Chloroperoxidase [Pholiota molesta]